MGDLLKPAKELERQRELEDKPLIVTVSGKARHGKDTFADYLYVALKDLGIKTEITHFADGVKEKAREFGWDGKKDNNGRILLQFIGTEWGRRCIDENIWVRKTEQHVREMDADVVLIPDTRFINEATYFGENGYEQVNINVVRLNEDGTIYDNGMTEAQKNHASERGLDLFDAYEYKYYFKSVEEIRDTTQKLAEKWRTKYGN